jgi:hypothetical protein
MSTTYTVTARFFLPESMNSAKIAEYVVARFNMLESALHWYEKHGDEPDELVVAIKALLEDQLGVTIGTRLLILSDL